MESRPRSTLLSRLYTQNPFYVISAVLMLFAVRSGYGHLEIGAINCSVMMGVLAGYTVVLATLAVLLVRFGRVWDDARSLFLLVLLLFVAVSVSADDLFATAASAGHGILLVVVGYLFSAVVSEAVLRCSRIRLGLGYRLPYHAMLALFYLAPWWLTPELHQRPAAEQSWTLLAFPAVGGLLFLLLLPAVRRGVAYVADNGTPWPWPWFPWTVFGGFAFVIAFRSYVLSMTYGLTGPIWDYSSSGKTIVFDTIWGPYFLAPLAFALLLLLLEAGITSGSRRLVNRALTLSPALLLLALPNPLGGKVYFGFLETVTQTLGAPLWLTVSALVGFYALATVRGVRGADRLLAVGVLLLSVVGPETTDLSRLTSPEPWPLLAVGGVLLLRGLVRRRSAWCAASLLPLAGGAFSGLGESPFAPFAFDVFHHVLWGGVLLVGLVFRDDLARGLRPLGAMGAVFTVVLLERGELLAALPLAGRAVYFVILTATMLLAAKLCRSRSFLTGGVAVATLGGYGAVVVGFRRAVELLGTAAVSAFSWSVAALLVAILISAHKARWLPQRAWAVLPWRGAREPESGE